MSNQKEQFEKYYQQLIDTTTSQELSAVVKEVYAEDIALKPEYLFSKEDGDRFWTAHKNKKAMFAKAYGVEQNKLRTAEYLASIKQAKGDVKKLEEVRTKLAQQKYMGREDKLPLYKAIKEEIDSVTNLQKAV